MGVYIPNIEKPKSCGECKFFCGLGYGFHCYLNGKHITFIGEVEDDCPLIGIDLVRCKDCKWSYTDERDGILWCKVHMIHYRVNDDGFCNYGERRADEHTD